MYSGHSEAICSGDVLGGRGNAVAAIVHRVQNDVLHIGHRCHSVSSASTSMMLRPVAFPPSVRPRPVIFPLGVRLRQRVAVWMARRRTISAQLWRTDPR